MKCERCGRDGADHFIEVYDPLRKAHETYRVCLLCCQYHYDNTRVWLTRRVPEVHL